MNTKRLNKLKRELKKKDKLPYLVTDLTNIRYLTGFKGTFGRLIICRDQSYFISDSRYEEYARSILPGNVSFVLQSSDPYIIIRDIMKSMGRKNLNLEEHAMTLSIYLEMKRRLRGIKLIPGGDEVNYIRMIKDDEEIDVLAKAARITDWCVDYLKGIIRPGVTEWEVANEIEIFYRENDCRKSSFDTIVASGPGASMPHYQTSMTKVIEAGEPVLVDMGCLYEGYNSDLTRTFFVHSIEPFFENIYNIVRKAQETACDAVRPGVKVGRLDSIARDIIAGEGYGEYFGHSLGHGLGLEVHEMPAVKDSDFTLKKNMAITIEPGIYVPGRGGVRIEDMVLVTGKGRDILTSASREITVV